jgi:hypothetical protein
MTVRPVLLTAEQAGAMIGVTAATWRRMVDQGRVPACIQHKSTFGQGRCRRYSRHLIELWSANVDIEHLDVADLADVLSNPPTTARHSPAGRAADPSSPLDGPPPGGPLLAAALHPPVQAQERASALPKT